MDGEAQRMSAAEAPALKAAGLARLRQGEGDAAADLLARAWACAPGDPEVAFHLGTLALAAGDPATAAVWLREALAGAPGVPEVYVNAGTALARLGSWEAAEAVARQGVAMCPADARVHATLGGALAGRGDGMGALACYERALALDPAGIDAAIGRANQLRDLGRTADARTAYADAIARHPGQPDAHGGLGLLEQQAERHVQAAREFRRALALRPNDAAAANNLAISLLELGRNEEALALWRDLAREGRHAAQTQANLAQTLQGLGRHGEAAQAFRAALALRPGDLRLAAAALQSLRYLCAWDEAEVLEARILAELEGQAATGAVAAGIAPFALAGTAATPALRLAVARAWGSRLSARARAASGLEPFRHAPPATLPQRLRIGLVSPDFRRHSVGLALADVARHLRRADCEWIGYSLSRRPPDALTAHYAETLDGFADLAPLSLAERAERIRADGIDVLVDLAGPTRDAEPELFVLRPAPVQAHWLGWGATLAVEGIDYLLTDAVHTPPDLEAALAEAPVLLPDSFMAAPAPQPLPEPPPRDRLGLPADAVVLAAFNAPHKLDRATFALWLRLLAEVPQAVLWLTPAPAEAQTALRRMALLGGIAPERLVFAERQPDDLHRCRLQAADLALDTLAHAGGVTTLDALAAGLPVVACAGASHAARTGASLLAAAGLADLVAPTAEAYLALAAGLTRDAGRRAGFRARVAAARQASALFDPAACAEALAQACRAMWDRFAAGLPPGRIVLPR